MWSASTYLVSKTFESLREMFTSTKEIQVKYNYNRLIITAVEAFITNKKNKGDNSV